MARTQRGFILLPVVLAIVLIATIAFLVTTESAINVDMTANTTAAAEVEQVARAGLAHATWGVQNSSCAGDMGMTTVPFGQGGSDNYTATVNTPGGATTAYPNLVSDQDAWFRSDNVTNNNGTNTTYHLRRESGNLEYAVVRYDLSTLPAGAQINSAQARFYVKSGNGHPEGPVTVHRVTADWTETDATWGTLGDRFDSAVLDTIPAQPDAGDAWVTVNLTAQVQAWVNGGQPNYGIMLIPTGEGTHAEYISREGAASQQPQLDVIVGTGPATPATISVTGTLTGNPSPTNDITRTLTRTAVPAYQPPGTVTLQLGNDPGEDGMPDSFYDMRNYGGADYMQVHDNGSDWQQYPLIRFDLGRLPRGAAVRSAQLELRLQSLNAPGTATIHQVTRSWVEGTRWGTGTADGVTWFTHDGINAWTSAGGDINTPVVAETAINGSETWVGWEIAPLVERWLAGEPNHGLQIRPGSGLDQANFASKENATVGVQPKLTITYACECGSPCIAPQGKGNIIMVVVNPTTLVPADAYKKALFESWGYTVSVLSESANQSSYDSAVATADVVYISETVNSSQVGTKLANAPIGVITEDGLYNDALGISNNAGITTGSAINITDTSHYITGIFPSGPLDIYDADMEQLVIFNGPAPDLQTLADVGGYSSLVVLEAGATLKGGATAAGRRAMLPLGRVANFNWDYLNHNGRLIVQRALQWGTGNTGGPPQNLLLVIAGSTPTAQEQLRIDLIESWGYSVNLIEEGDSQANFDAAIAANDVAYIPQSVASPTLGARLANASIGVVNEDGEQVDELGFSQDKTYKTNHEIDVVDNTHYITQPFATGFLTYLSSDQSVHMLSGQITPGLQTLGQTFNVGSQYKPSLAVLDAGAELWDGGNAAGRRVELPWGGGTFDFMALNADGQTIMQRAIAWAEGAGAGAPESVLLVVADASSLDSKESAAKALIESWGYSVTAISANASQADYDTALAGVDVVYISGTISSAELGSKLAGTTVGVVSEDAGTMDEMGIAEPVLVKRNTQFISIVDNTHYVTSGLSLGDLAIVSSSIDIWTANGALAPGLQVLGETQVAGTGYPPGVAVLETGAALYGGGFAAGRRVQVPWSQGSSTFDLSALTADGLNIMRRAIEWGAGATSLTAPIAHWKLDETAGSTAIDSEGGHNGTLINGFSWDTGVIDGGLSFDGVNDYINVPHDTNLTFTGGLTFTAWGNTLDTSGGYKAILAKDTPGNGASNYWFGIENDELVFGFWAAGSFRTVKTSGSNLQSGTWYHLAASFDNATDAVRLYVGGTEVQLGAITDEPTTETADLWIGHSPDGEYWNGKLDDVRIYNTVLGGSEISDLVAGGGGGGGGPPPGPGATLPASDDATVFESNPGGNYGSDTTLKAGKTTAQGGKLYSSAIRFDLSSLPAGATITSATLRLYQTFDSGTGTIDVGAYKATNTWDEATVTWNTLVDDGIQLVSSSVTLGTADWTEWVLPSALVQEWLDIANNGIVLRYETGTKGKTVGFASKESTPSDLHPQLVVEYTAP